MSYSSGELQRLFEYPNVKSLSFLGSNRPELFEVRNRFYFLQTINSFTGSSFMEKF